MAKQHRRFEPADKIKILREHLLDGRPLSEVCEKYSIAPTQFYQWQKTFFENGAAAFVPPKPGREYGLENKVKQLMVATGISRTWSELDPSRVKDLIQVVRSQEATPKVAPRVVCFVSV